ncbi:hypothetical protein MnTg02_02516 [bacterium MnTg02]|nr:hypothetical protein MnTg02_02516 [bacterium MnTg02]
MNPASRLGKAIVPVAMLVLFVAIMVALAATPYTRIGMNEQNIEEKRVLLAKIRKNLIKQATLGQENERLAALSQEASYLLEGATTGIAGATLQKLVIELVRNHNGVASSFQILAPEKDHNLTRIAVSLTIRIGIDGLRNYLYDLETGMPLIFINNLTVRSPDNVRKTAGPDFLGPYDVTMTVSGFVVRGGNSGT